jgi:hypothetical protein
MNPGSGRVHATLGSLRELAAVEAKGKGESEVTAALERASQKLIRESARSTVPQGAELPPDWPRFELGGRIGPIKGWWFKVVDVDLETQQILIEPDAPARRKKVSQKKKRKRRMR